MSTPQNTTEQTPSASPQADAQNESPRLPEITKDGVRHSSSNNKLYAVAAAAFAIGVVGAVTVTSRQHQGNQATTSESTQADTPVEKPSDSTGVTEVSLIKFNPAAVQAAGVKVQTVQRSFSSEMISAPGTVMTSPNHAARVTPPVGGKVVRIYASQGDRVQAGQPLIALDSVDIAQAHAAVRQAESNVVQMAAAANTARAQLREAQAKQEAAEATLIRQRQLAKVGAFSQAPLATAQSELSQAKAELAQAQSELQIRTSAAARAERLFAAQIVSRAELEQAQADLRQSQARSAQASNHVAVATQALSREKKIFGGDLLNRQAIQTAEAEVRSARAETQTAIRQAQAASAAVQGAKDAVGAARANLYAVEGDRHADGGAGMIVLRAPLSGVVTERQATVGEAIERSTTLFQIENLNSVLVSANVPEAQISQVRLGQRADVTVSSYPDVRFAGTVQSLGSRVDEKTRALPVRLVVENMGGRLRPEMFARVSLGVGKAASDIVVPASAVDDDGPNRFVYVERPGGFEKREVQVGRTTHGSAVILSGLKPGERVVTDGAFILKSESKKDELKGDD